MRDRITDTMQDLRPLMGGQVHLGDLTAVLARRYGQRPAIEDPAATPGIHEGGARSFDDVEDAVARLAAAHRDAGRTEGERALLLIGNRIDILLHALALSRIGAIPVPVNARLKTAEIAAIAESSGARVLVADDEVADGFAEATELGDLTVARTGDLGAWAKEHANQRLAEEGRDPSAVALLLTTSGTTGTPKAAALTSRGLMSSLGYFAGLPVGFQRGPRAGRDVAFAALPLTHVMGFAVALACLTTGVLLVRRDHFDAAEALALIEERRPNVFIGVPTMYADLEAADAEAHDLSCIQLWVSAADSMPTERARRFQRYGAASKVADQTIGSAVFLDIYGMVELSGAAAFRVYPPSPVKKLAIPSVAIVAPGLAVRAVDEDGDEVGWGTKGELQFRGNGVLQGYEGHEDAGPDEDGWFASGDFGRVWPGRVFQFAGRSKDRLKVGGFSVFPAEIEEELTQADAVSELAIVGVPDDRLGERLIALVVPTRRADFDPDAFLEWAAEQVAGYRRPREVVVVDEIPRGNNAKVDRDAATTLATDHLADTLADTPADVT